MGSYFGIVRILPAGMPVNRRPHEKRDFGNLPGPGEVTDNATFQEAKEI
jgi:hypothetical protein